MDKIPPSNRVLTGILLALDVLGLHLGYAIALAVRMHNWQGFGILPTTVFFFVATNIFCLYLLNLYSVQQQVPLWIRPVQAISASFISGCAIVLVSYFAGAIEFTGVIGRGVLISAQIGFAVWSGGTRFVLFNWMRRLNRESRWLVLGSSDIFESITRDLKSSTVGYFAFLSERPDATLSLDAIESKPLALPPGATASSAASPLSVIARPAMFESEKGLALAHVGSWDDFDDLAKQPWSGVIVGTTAALPDKLIENLMWTRLKGIRVYNLTDFYERTLHKVPVFCLQRSWFAMARGFSLLHNPIGLKIKQVLDVVLASILLLIASPVLLFAMLAIKLESKGPVLYRQVRVGADEIPFTVYKLRSMRTDAESDGAKWTTKGDTRITRVGNFIRKTRIDELPQLFNVLKGEMSFIGPRPERPEFTRTLENEIPFYQLRHMLRPGITGWAQVMYPYGASVADATEKLQYDLYYIKNYSLLLDLAIILKTVRVVLFGQGR